MNDLPAIKFKRLTNELNKLFCRKYAIEYETTKTAKNIEDLKSEYFLIGERIKEIIKELGN